MLAQQVKRGVEILPLELDRGRQTSVHPLLVSKSSSMTDFDIRSDISIPASKIGKTKKSRRSVDFLGTSAAVPTWFLFLFRMTAFTFCFIQLMVWYWTAPWSVQPPVLFLTNWGFVVCISYFWCSTCCSYMKIFTKWRKLSFWFYFTVCTLFELGVVLEVSITLLYWSLIFPSDYTCGVVCISAHAVSTTCIIIDYLFNRHYLEAHHLRRVMIVVTIWLVTQLIWVYTGHVGVYPVLTLRDSLSIIVVMGGFFTQTVAFYALQRLGRWRDYMNGDFENQPFRNIDDLDDFEL
mmetsp:Transcript_34511/g.45616  ORF Transcript_34511/g.45616 Transcript_34511/m.45616 type:complete len:292 (-) Transcript_34511:543-1418(-)